MRELVLGTRGSALALWQARHVAERLIAREPGLALRERVIRTHGDVSTAPTFGLGDRGVFVRRIEEALLAGDIDLAVHSLKDLPSEQPEGLVLAAVLERHDPRDILLTPQGATLEELPPACLLGTGSPRRRAQLLHARPDLVIAPVRGNVDTRLAKLREGRFGGIVLAMAGVERLGLDSVPWRPLDPAVCLPAVGQGAMVVEARADDERVLGRLAALEHAASRQAITAERGFLSRLGGGCMAPATAHATVEGERIAIEAVVGEPDGGELLRERSSGTVAQARELGSALAEQLLASGAARILEACRDASPDGR